MLISIIETETGANFTKQITGKLLLRTAAPHVCSFSYVGMFDLGSYINDNYPATPFDRMQIAVGATHGGFGYLTADVFGDDPGGIFTVRIDLAGAFDASAVSVLFVDMTAYFFPDGDGYGNYDHMSFSVFADDSGFYSAHGFTPYLYSVVRIDYDFVTTQRIPGNSLRGEPEPSSNPLAVVYHRNATIHLFEFNRTDWFVRSGYAYFAEQYYWNDFVPQTIIRNDFATGANYEHVSLYEDYGIAFMRHAWATDTHGYFLGKTGAHREDVGDWTIFKYAFSDDFVASSFVPYTLSSLFDYQTDILRGIVSGNYLFLILNHLDPIPVPFAYTPCDIARINLDTMEVQIRVTSSFGVVWPDEYSEGTLQYPDLAICGDCLILAHSARRDSVSASFNDISIVAIPAFGSSFSGATPTIKLLSDMTTAPATPNPVVGFVGVFADDTHFYLYDIFGVVFKFAVDD